MKKVLINLFVPAIGEYFDVFVPDSLLIKDVCTLLGDSIQELSNKQYISSGEEVLCSLDKKQILRPERNLMEYGIRNGEHLLLC